MPSTVADAVVHVAVGILTDGECILVARRPLSAHLGGLWEFPGGKVHAGETVEDALRRELNEELGVAVLAARPLMQVRHAYPDKIVLLDVWTVTDYRGSAHGREGQDTHWARPDELLTLEFPEADRPILHRLWLPPHMAISACGRLGVDVFFERLERALVDGLKLLQWREPEMTEDDFVALGRDVGARCHRAGARMLVNAEPRFALACGADGVHLSAQRLMRCEMRPMSNRYLVGASCHNPQELHQAQSIGADFALLGPVMPTRSHPDAVPMGWQRFMSNVQETALPVYALGGLRFADLASARTYGAAGIAMIDGYWGADGAAVTASDGSV